ncbi:MAG TPA: S41 family peptidase [Polyangiaceae bacterium]|nr:S41 family peptidase [Polyangiaceae bacterium]
MKTSQLAAVSLASLALAAAACAGLYARHEARVAAAPTVSVHEKKVGPVAAPDEAPDEDDDTPGYAFHTPSGRPSALRCDDARRIVSQVQGNMAAPPASAELGPFVESASDWLDPHALWSVAADAPREALGAELRHLLPELQPRHAGGCSAADASGEILARWVDELRALFDAGRASATTADLSGASAPLPAAGEAKIAARELGLRIGGFERAVGPEGTRFAEGARERFFPPLAARAWGEMVLSAAVRAYVPLVDPHGAWAPYDEEASVYDVDLAAHAPHPLWTKSEITPVGVALSEGVAAPLVPGDVLLSLADVPLAGLPIEQIEQLGFVASEAKAAVHAIVLRAGKLVTLPVGGPRVGTPTQAAEDALAALPVERVKWGAGDVVVVAIRDVREDLGEELARVLRREREQAGARAVAGVVLDLRGNGGGSTDGAMHAIGLFLPGVSLFPMKRRDGTVEVERATEPPEQDVYRGPVATLVDGATASAAEMMAGALATYGRGPSLGRRTFGKGCAQEYFDDEPRTGILRLTTLLYALPDGTPVQRVGLTPSLMVPFEGAGVGPVEGREATIAHAPPSWRGPDMRAGKRPRGDGWSALHEDVGACKDPDVCLALRSLAFGWPRRAPVAKKR